MRIYTSGFGGWQPVPSGSSRVAELLQEGEEDTSVCLDKCSLILLTTQISLHPCMKPANKSCIIREKNLIVFFSGKIAYNYSFKKIKTDFTNKEH